MNNNEIIDHPDYYCIRQNPRFDLEDFIEEQRLTFVEGSALKYLYRAGCKHGESAEKDEAKAHHFCEFLARKRYGTTETWLIHFRDMVAYLRSLKQQYEEQQHG